MKLLEDSGSAGFTVQKLSIERIAREAGVSKTTIYRWWSSKVAVVIDTFLDNHVARTPVREDVPAIDALREHMASLAEVYAGKEGRLVAQLIGECQQDEATMAEFKNFSGSRERWPLFPGGAGHRRGVDAQGSRCAGRHGTALRPRVLPAVVPVGSP